MFKLVIRMIQVYHLGHCTSTGRRFMDYQPPGKDYVDYVSEPCEWLLIPVRPEVSNAPYLDYSAAIHEASHAVLCEHFGYKITSVTIQAAMGRFAEIEPTKQSPEHII